jgi:hypothetical protein
MADVGGGREFQTTIALARRGLRHRPWSWALMVLVIGVAGSIVLGCVAGARRTASAHARYLRATNAADVGFPSDPTCGERPCTVEDFAAIDGVAQVARFVRLIAVVELPDGSVVPSENDATMLGLAGGPAWSVDRPLVVDGRLPASDADDEVLVNTTFAERHHLGVDDALALRTFTFDEIEGLLAEAQGGPKVGTSQHLRIVGVGVVGTDLVQGEIVIAPEPAAAQMNQFGALFSVELERGARGVNTFVEAVDQRFHFSPEDVTAASHAQAQRTVRPYVVALAGYAALVLLIGLALSAQAAAREEGADIEEHEVLRAIGVTPTQWRAAAAGRMALAALVGTIAAVAGALAASRWTPVGPIRRFEPQPGIAADVTVLLGGAVVWLILMTASGFVGAWVAGRRGRPRRATDLAIVRALPLTIANAVRFVRPTSARETHAPVRAGIGGLATAVLLLTAVVTFASGLHRLVETPRLYGWTFDATLFLGYNGTDADRVAAAAAVLPGLASDPVIAGVTQLAGSAIDLEGKHVDTTGTAGDGGAFPLISGRPPAAPDEVVLGPRTAGRVDVHGLDGAVVTAGDGTSSYTVVGYAIFPGSSGEGAWMTLDGLRRVVPDVAVSQFGVRFMPGASADTQRAAFERAMETVQPFVQDATVDTPVPPTEADSLLAVDDLPIALAIALAAGALATLANILLLAVRARRRDLATLRACGYSTSQVWATLLAQSTLIALGALAIGLPLGVAIGRWSWSTWARGIGVVDAAVTPVAFLALVVPVALAATILTTIGPARRASHLPVAETLRSE